MKREREGMGVFVNTRAGGIPSEGWIVDLAGEELYLHCTARPHGKARDDPEKKYRERSTTASIHRVATNTIFEETLRRRYMLWSSFWRHLVGGLIMREWPGEAYGLMMKAKEEWGLKRMKDLETIRC